MSRMLSNLMYGTEKAEVKMPLSLYEALMKRIEIMDKSEMEARKQLDDFIDHILKNAYDDVNNDLAISTYSIKGYIKEHFPVEYKAEIQRREELRKQKEEQNG